VSDGQFEILLWTPDGGRSGVGERILSILARQPASGNAIRSALGLLAEHGLRWTPGVKRLRHAGGAELYELRSHGKPPYRVFVSPVKSGAAFLVLDVVERRELASPKAQQAAIARSLDRLQDWLDRQPETESPAS
jgi:hypothetical protein